MEEFEINVINTTTNPPRIWFKCVDDTFVIQRVEHSQEFLQHINFIELYIQFTTEDIHTDGSLPFLDTLITSGPDNTLLTTVYRKPTHTNKYLHWDSHYNLPVKLSAFNYLTHTAKTVCANPKLLHKEA